MTNRKLYYELSIDTRTDDLRWTSVSVSVLIHCRVQTNTAINAAGERERRSPATSRTVIRHDRRYSSWTRKPSIQHNLAHVARKWNKQSNAPLIQYRLRSVKASVWKEKEWLCHYGGRICELSLEWKVEEVIGNESEGGDRDEVICAGWGEPGREWT